MLKVSNRERYLLKTYGITLQQYNQLLQQQNDSCWICKKPMSLEGRSLAVDHDHKTMYIRGLLCSFCNRRVIGRHTNPDLFEAASRYLRQHTGWLVPVKKRKRKRRK